MSGTTTPSIAQQQQVSHWIHDEQACVTVQRIAQTFQLSWSDASSLLKNIPEEGRVYSLTSFAAAQSNTVPTAAGNNKHIDNVFQLVKSKLGGGKNDTLNKNESGDCVWYALALDSCTESIHTSHERDRSQFQQDCIGQFVIPMWVRGKTTKMESSSEGFATSIPVSEHLKQRSANANSNKGGDDDDDADNFVPAAKVTSSRTIPTKKTTTTARNFFSANGNASKMSAKSSTAKKGSVSCSKPSSKSNNGKKGSVPFNNSTLSFSPKKPDGTQSKNSNNAKKRENCDEEKENVQNRKSSKAKVGNADDFVGDMDTEDDDDDNDEVIQIKDDSDSEELSRVTKDLVKPNAISTKRVATARQPSRSNDDDDTGSEEETPEEATNTTKKHGVASDGTKPHRRRKRMVEKTFTDEHGYLYTETQAVWEDVPSDEEEETSAKNISSKGGPGKKTKKKAAPSKAMKQGNLLNFFAKKK